MGNLDKKTKKMKFAATLLFAAVLSSDVLAQYGRGSAGGTSDTPVRPRREPPTKAQCVINMDDPDTLDFRGSAVFKQRQRFNGDGELLDSKYFVRFGNLAAEQTYSVALLDDDIDPCGSALEPLSSFGGKTFALDPAGESTTAGFNGRIDIDLSGDMSYIGKFL